jgi:hypothetical protein
MPYSTVSVCENCKLMGWNQTPGSAVTWECNVLCKETDKIRKENISNQEWSWNVIMNTS